MSWLWGCMVLVIKSGIGIICWSLFLGIIAFGIGLVIEAKDAYDKKDDDKWLL